MEWIIIGVVALVVVLFFLIMKAKNTLVIRKNKVKNSWANVDVQLQRRCDLIPNLVEVVQSFATHELQIIESIVEARKGYLESQDMKEKLAMNEQLSSQLKSLFIISENYPDLKSDAHFLQLQSALTEIEEDISYARQFYNDAVTIYNNKIQLFPHSMIASMFNFKEEQLFTAVKGAEKAPQININIKRKTKYNQCPVCGASVSEGETDCKYCNSKLT